MEKRAGQRHNRDAYHERGRGKKLRLAVAVSIKELNCQTCKDKAGCEEDSPASVYAIDGEDIYRCPLRLITPQSSIYMQFYYHYKNGYLPVQGGILDQSAKFLKAMTIIENTISKELKPDAR